MLDKENKVVQQEIIVTRELSAAELESESISKRYNHEEVMTKLRSKIATVQKNK